MYVYTYTHTHVHIQRAIENKANGMKVLTCDIYVTEFFILFMNFIYLNLTSNCF